MTSLILTFLLIGISECLLACKEVVVAGSFENKRCKIFGIMLIPIISGCGLSESVSEIKAKYDNVVILDIISVMITCNLFDKKIVSDKN